MLLLKALFYEGLLLLSNQVVGTRFLFIFRQSKLQTMQKKARNKYKLVNKVNRIKERNENCPMDG